MALPAVIIIIAGCEKLSIAVYYALHLVETVGLNSKKFTSKKHYYE